MRPQSIKVPRTCLYCGISFMAPAEQVHRGYGKYCSRGCLYAARTVSSFVPCATCGTIVKVQPSKAKQGNKHYYCSKECSYVGRGIPLEERLWSKVNKTDDCWIWTGATKQFGYGQIGVDGQTKLAHRVAWELTNGQIPEGLEVCHHCDTPSCVNPAHLFLGTHEDNMLDMKSKGRGKRLAKGKQGSAHHKAKLTEDDIRVIRDLITDGMTQRRIARQFGVSQSTISSIFRGELWRHVQ